MEIFNIFKEGINKVKSSFFSAKEIVLKEEDILISLKYNMILNQRKYIADSNGIIYDIFMKFDYLEDMKEFYEIKDKELRVYIDKYDKLKQLVTNIALYLGTVDKAKLIYDDEKYILYTNIQKFLSEAEKFNRKFDVEKFFNEQSWVKSCEKIEEVSLKIFLYDRDFIQRNYKIIYKSNDEIIGVYEKEYAKIDLKNKKICFGLKL